MNITLIVITIVIIILIVYFVFLARNPATGKTLYNGLMSYKKSGGWSPLPEEFSNVVDGINWDISESSNIFVPYLPEYQNNDIQSLSYSYNSLATYFGVMVIPQGKEFSLEVDCESYSYNEIIVSRFPSWQKIIVVPCHKGKSVLNFKSDISNTFSNGQYHIPPNEPITILWARWGNSAKFGNISSENRLLNTKNISVNFPEKDDTYLEENVEEIYDLALEKITMSSGIQYVSHDKAIRPKIHQGFPKLENGKSFSEEISTYPGEEWLVIVPIRQKTVNALYHHVEIKTSQMRELKWIPIKDTNRIVDAYYFIIPDGVYSFEICERIGGINQETKLYPMTIYHIHQK